MKVDRETGEIIKEENQPELFKVHENGDIEPSKNKGEIAWIGSLEYKKSDFIPEGDNPFLTDLKEQNEQEEYIEGEIPNIGKALINVPPITQDIVIKQMSDEAIKIQQYANNLIVSDVNGDKQATNDLSMIASMKKQIKTKQDEWLAPIKAHEKEIKEAFALLSGPLDNADKILRGKVLSFRQEQERKRQEEERAAELQRQDNEARMKLAEQNNEQVVDIEPVPEVVTEAPAKTVRADIGQSSTTKTWKWRFKEGLSKKQILEGLPIEYHMVNETLIGQLVRAKNKNQVSEADFGGVIELYEEAGLRVSGR